MRAGACCLHPRRLAKGGAAPRFEVFQADISNATDRAGLLQAVQERFGWIDLLVNNAGVAPSARVDLLQAGEESFDRLMNINVRGPYFLTQAVANFWIRDLDRGRRKAASRRSSTSPPSPPMPRASTEATTA